MSSPTTGAVTVEGPPLLNYEAVFRIEVSLSSRTTSAIVMRTTARLYCLEGVQSSRPRIGDAEWKSVAYGAPCIQLIRQDKENQSAVFTIRVVIAEVESGISLWEGVVDGYSRYSAMLGNFHTFISTGNTYAIQFVSESEAERMLESIHDLLSQQQQLMAGKVGGQTSGVEIDSVLFKKPSKPPRRLTKKDISSPCNFKHVSGITMERTQSCEHELKGTIQRKMRSFSLSNLTTRSRNGSTDAGTEDGRMSGRRLSMKKSKTIGRKFTKESVDGEESGNLGRGEANRMSLPSHFHPRERKPITSASFVPPSSSSSSSSSATKPRLNKTLSQSSGDLPREHGQRSHSPPELRPSVSSTHKLRRSQTLRDHSRRHQEHPTTTTPALQQTLATPTQAKATPTNQSPMVTTPGGVNVNASPSHNLTGQAMRQVAIASSDIVGWTADGRLIIQMPTNSQASGATEVGVVKNSHQLPSRRASTGQFAPDLAIPAQVMRQGGGGSGTIPTPSQSAAVVVQATAPSMGHPTYQPAPQTTVAKPVSMATSSAITKPSSSSSSQTQPMRKVSANAQPQYQQSTLQKQKAVQQEEHQKQLRPKTLHHSTSDSRTLRNRPLPPTPLDIAMPQSAARNHRPIHRTSSLTEATPISMPTVTTPVSMTTASTPISMTTVTTPTHHLVNGYNPAVRAVPPPTAPAHYQISIGRDALPTQSHAHKQETPPPPSHAHSDSVEASLQEVTDQMSRALAQFDDLLGVAQTSL